MKKVLTIALTTFRESMRSKILYTVLFFAVAMVLLAALFGTVTIGDQVRVIKDFGLMSISLFPVSFAVVSGAALLHKELSKKTVYNILAKPVRRWQFLLGKYFGMLATTSVMALLMGAGLLLFSAVIQGSFDLVLLQSFVCSFCELIIICAAAIFFSSIVVTPLLSGLFTFGIFLAGRSANYVLYFIDQKQTGTGTAVLKVLYEMLPHLDTMNISNQVVYGHSVGLSFLVTSLVYSIGYAAVLLLLATVIFSRREFN